MIKAPFVSPNLFALFIFLVTTHNGYAANQSPLRSGAPVLQKRNNPLKPMPATQPVPTASSNTAAAPAAPAPAPNKWRASYSGEMAGPRFSNFDLSKTQEPDSPTAAYTTWDQSLKLGYMIANGITLGVRQDASANFDPLAVEKMTFRDFQTFLNWNHMVETDHIDMQGVLRLSFPTTDATRLAGKIIGIRAQNNWTIKTSLRNWAFTFSTSINNIFFTDPLSGGGRNDMTVGLFPYITVDLVPSIQWLFEAGFDSVHNYTNAQFDFASGDSDYFQTGPIFSIGSHISTTIASRFFVENPDPEKAILYFNVSVAL